MREPTEILPEEIAQFLHAENDNRREDSWSDFLARHHRLLLRVAHKVAPNREDAMDAYAMVLELLREDGGRRLRTYTADGRSKFTTWLVVVARRICVDFIRQKYGRYAPSTTNDNRLDRTARHSLAELVGAGIDLAFVADETTVDPENALRSRELTTKLDDAMRELSVDDRLLLKLRFEDDLSASAIARLLGSPTPFHVYRRLNALLAQLRSRLSARGVESSQP